MLAVISPAKSLDYDTPPLTTDYSAPELLGRSAELIKLLRRFDAAGLARLMALSPRLAELNVARYADWDTPFTPQNAKQAVLAMKGSVYTGLDAEGFDAADFAFAQRHLRILSGLYGVLRPLDLMRPYRLEMGTRLENPRGRDLYAFWGDTITDTLNRALAEQGDDLLLNLASNEYFKAVQRKRLQGRLLTLSFKQRKGDGYRTIGVLAKRARGQMARFLITERIGEPERLKRFDADGYRFAKRLSSDAEWVFVRD